MNQNVILKGNPGHLKEDQHLTKKKHETSREDQHGGQTKSLVEQDRCLKKDLRNLKINLILMNDRDVDHHRRRNPEDGLNHQDENSHRLEHVLGDALRLVIAPSVGIRRVLNALLAVMKN